MNNQLTRFEQAVLEHMRRHTPPEQQVTALNKIEQYLPPDGWQPRPMPMRGSLPQMFEWITHEGLAIAMGASFAVGTVAVIAKLVIWAFR